MDSESSAHACSIDLDGRWEHSAVLSTFIKLPFVIKIFVLSIFEWPFYTVLLYIRNRVITRCVRKGLH